MKYKQVESHPYNQSSDLQNVIEKHLSRFRASPRRITQAENKLNLACRTTESAGD